MEKQIPTLKLKVKNFRAIQSADIIIDGITVVTGENGCGKSTLSKLLYDTIQFSNNFETEVYFKLHTIFEDLFTIIEELNDLIEYYQRTEKIKDEQKIPINSLDEIINKEHNFNDRDSILEYVDYLSVVYEKYIIEFESKIPKAKIDKVIRFMNDLSDEITVNNIIAGIKTVKESLVRLFSDSDHMNEIRPLSLWENSIRGNYNTDHLDLELEVYGDNIIDRVDQRLGKVRNINDIVYIYSPIMLDSMSNIRRKSDKHIDHLYSILNGNVNIDHSTSFNSELENVMNGYAYYEDQIQSKGFKFKRNDGEVYNLIDCATGLKSFSILQLLLNNGLLKKDTLILLDEPEAHLHPQWIVEYARLIIMLNKDFGVKFLIASHNPDMIGALRMISEENKNLDLLNFYLAEKITPFHYSYTTLNKNIDPIFESFNIALDKIAEYGVKDE